MNLELDSINWDILEEEITSLFKKLFPICRSITGNGVRKTLQELKNICNFDIKEIPSGTQCYDWEIPEEWNINEAYIKDSKGNTIIDFKKNNLHVVNYSISVNNTINYKELCQHIHTLPDMPDAIPYRTTYYNKNWGFCMTDNQFKKLNKNDTYHVYIDSSLHNGSLTYGEYIKKGTSGKEYLFSTYCCHPSLANDNLSGPILWSLLLRELQKIKTNHTYRFVIIPETIGAIAYLHKNEAEMQNIDGGYILTTVAGPDKFGYKETFMQNDYIDIITKHTFKELKINHINYPFDISGSDETSYSAPFFRIPMGTITKSKYYEYDYYHTSKDNLDFISSKSLIESMKLYFLNLQKLEYNSIYQSLMPYCEPRLGKRGLYPQIGGHVKQSAANIETNHEKRPYQIDGKEIIFGNELDAILWLAFYSDGKHSLLDIATITNIPFKQLYLVAEKMVKKQLLKK